MSELLADWAVTVGAVVGLLTGLGIIIRKWVWPATKMIRRTIIAADRLFPFAEYQLKPNAG